MPAPSLDHLIIPIGEGDTKAFQSMVELSFDGLVRFAYTYVKSREVAEDLVQTVYLRLWEQRATLAPHGSLMAYLLGAVRHRTLDALRRNDVRSGHRTGSSDAVPGNTPAIADGRPLPIDMLVRADEAKALRDLVATLPERRRLALRLRYVDRLTHAEIGSILGVSPKAAKELLARTLEALRISAGDQLEP